MTTPRPPSFLTNLTGFVRRYATEWVIRREATRPAPFFTADQIGETRSFEIIPLYEAGAVSDYQCGSGVSYLIRTDRFTILFDFGNNPKASSPSPLAENMRRMGIGLEGLDAVFVSHRHPDHVGGWKWWERKTFSMDGATQPAMGALPVYASDRIYYPGLPVTRVRQPRRLAAGVMTTGAFTFAEPYPSLRVLPDYSEHALAVNVAKVGLVLITGCGHMRLTRLLDRAKAIYGVPVAGVVGGLHCTNATAEAVQPEINYLKACKPGLVAVSAHDSGPVAVAAFAAAFPESYRPLRVGESIRLP